MTRFIFEKVHSIRWFGALGGMRFAVRFSDGSTVGDLSTGCIYIRDNVVECFLAWAADYGFDVDFYEACEYFEVDPDSLYWDEEDC